MDANLIVVTDGNYVWADCHPGLWLVGSVQFESSQMELIYQISSKWLLHRMMVLLMSLRSENMINDPVAVIAPVLLASSWNLFHQLFRGHAQQCQECSLILGLHHPIRGIIRLAQQCPCGFVLLLRNSWSVDHVIQCATPGQSCKYSIPINTNRHSNDKYSNNNNIRFQWTK